MVLPIADGASPANASPPRKRAVVEEGIVQGKALRKKGRPTPGDEVPADRGRPPARGAAARAGPLLTPARIAPCRAGPSTKTLRSTPPAKGAGVGAPISGRLDPATPTDPKRAAPPRPVTGEPGAVAPNEARPGEVASVTGPAVIILAAGPADTLAHLIPLSPPGDVAEGGGGVDARPEVTIVRRAGARQVAPPMARVMVTPLVAILSGKAKAKGRDEAPPLLPGLYANGARILAR